MAGQVDWMRVHQEWGVLDPSTEQEGFGQCLWNTEAHKMCKKCPDSGAKTMVEILEKTKEKYSTKNAAGMRNVVKVHMVDEGGAKREKIEYANEYSWLTYGEYYERVLCLARGLAQLGLKPQDKVVIYAETQRDWMVAAFAAWHSNAQIVTIYATLGEEGAIHGINETEASIVVCDAKLLKVLSNVLPKTKCVKSVVTLSKPDRDLAKKITGCNVTLDDVDEVVNKGKTWAFSASMPTSEDIAVIMYTSGTTGTPKGVVLTHSNVCAVVAGVEHFFKGSISSEDVYLAYLPLAHIMEMAAEVCFMSFGCSLGFGTPHSLTDTGVKLKRPESMGDAPCLQPTFMVFAPAVLDKVYQAVIAKRDGLGSIARALFNMGLSSGERHFKRGQVGANRIFNMLVFKKIQALLGGRLRGCVTGSAPLSPDIQMFIQTVLDVPVRQGYGLTETCAGSCVAFWGDNEVSTVGPPTVSAVVRLADWPEGNYMNSDKDKPEIGMRRGEVLIGGPAVSLGYYINPEKPNPELQKKNKEDWVVIGDTRFFRTGDVAQIKPNGTLQIIDRKKDLWKGPNGEYVALTKVEAALGTCEFVELSMCYGKTGGEYPVALVCPQKKRILALGQELGMGDKSFEALCGEKAVVDKVTESCRAACKAKKLVEFETPKKIGLISDLWTPENEMLTAAMKLKRPIIAQKHKEDIDKLY
eukprot:TRINITY_DN18022_c0_g1_i1.p2 TRINITY_DN18022_c0_g1~~TRINITY_DN18022_c0_g1_i1.p2  ORF type:complete len:695 (-),score=201.30 TRINITY_DN18022_c0_g1_i1:309-2393(-)